MSEFIRKTIITTFFILALAACGGPENSDVCGDSQITGTEECDWNRLQGETCITQGYQGGVLTCNPGDCTFDVSMCVDSVCGDEQITGAEECDGSRLQGQTCESRGYDSGILACDPNTCFFDVDGCSTCGDAQISDSEECDGGLLQEQTCQTQGYLNGMLACDPTTCMLEVSMCNSYSAIALTAGGGHTCALLDGGALRCWGSNDYGELGYGHTDRIGDDELPSTAGNVPLGGIAVAVAAGLNHTCALLDTGAVRCWGRNRDGRLGYGNTTNIGDDEFPSMIGDVPLGGTAVSISTGYYHTCALLDTGAVKCWGDSYSGQLGYGNTDEIGDDEFPSMAGDVHLGGIAVSVSAGGFHTCAVLDTGAVRCWGGNGNGQLGYGHRIPIGDNELPDFVGLVQLGGPAVSVSAGERHTCALLDTGAVRCWGDNDFGQLGYGNTTTIGDDEFPSVAGNVPIGGTAVSVSAGWTHTCALLDTAAVRCWGRGISGWLGYGNDAIIGDDEFPGAAGDIPIGSAVISLSVAGVHNCALLDTRAVRCWGSGSSGALGYGNTSDIGDDEFPGDAGNVPFE